MAGRERTGEAEHESAIGRGSSGPQSRRRRRRLLWAELGSINPFEAQPNNKPSPIRSRARKSNKPAFKYPTAAHETRHPLATSLAPTVSPLASACPLLQAPTPRASSRSRPPPPPPPAPAAGTRRRSSPPPSSRRRFAYTALALN